MLTQLLKSGLRKFRRQVSSVRPRSWVNLPGEYLGSQYGGWTIETGSITSESVVYSVGVGTDISFDLELIERFGCEVHAFDPTPRCLEWISQQSLPSQFSFHPIGLAAFDGQAEFHFPANPEHVSLSMVEQHLEESVPVSCEVRTLKTLLEENGHDRIDLLKIDIEGAEYDVISNVIQNGPLPQYLLAEFHHHFDGISRQQTITSLEQLKRSGYSCFAKDDYGREFSFVNTAIPNRSRS